MSEEETSTVTQLIQDGTNSSSTTMDGSSTSKSTSLLSKANLITRTDKLSERLETLKSTNNGISCTLMHLRVYQSQDSAKSGVCTSTDHSIFRLK